MFRSRWSLVASLLIASMLTAGCKSSSKNSSAKKSTPSQSTASKSGPVDDAPVVPSHAVSSSPTPAPAPKPAPVAAAPAVAPTPAAQPPTIPNVPEAYVPSQTAWTDFAALPGAKYAVYEGDPKSKTLFTMRLKFPDGFKVMPHSHPGIERVTVITGKLHLGSGSKFDERATTALPAGTFFAIPSGVQHFAWAEGETVLQLTGLGPWEIHYVNPNDDPNKPNTPAKKPPTTTN